jgi:hypothetical protein
VALAAATRASVAAPSTAAASIAAAGAAVSDSDSKLSADMAALVIAAETPALSGLAVSPGCEYEGESYWGNRIRYYVKVRVSESTLIALLTLFRVAGTGRRGMCAEWTHWPPRARTWLSYLASGMSSPCGGLCIG